MKNVRALLAVLLATGSLALSIVAQAVSPVAPCAGSSIPAYAAAGRNPNVQIWNSAALGAWAPPACLGWNGTQPNLVIAVAGTTPAPRSVEDLLKSFGSITTLSSIRYWSVTDQSWGELIREASATLDKDGATPRGDFRADEMTRGQVLYFTQQDARFRDTTVWRLQVRDVSAKRIAVEIENVSYIRALFLTVAKPGAMKSIYFFDRRPDGSWNSYAMMLATSEYAERNEASFVNRTMAFYRHFMGLPTDSMPPAAP